MSNPSLPSERSFGLLFVVVFAAAGVYGSLEHWNWALVGSCFAASVLLVLITLFASAVLAPLNKAWFQLGQLLGKIVSPIVLGIIFYGLLTPVALVTRVFGRDELKLKRRGLASYWVQRDPPGPASDSFKNQF